MNKAMPIELDYDGKTYILDFDMEAVKFAEARGFQWENVTRFPATTIPELFFYSFRRHHKNVSKQQTDKMLDLLGGLTVECIARLHELYDANIESVLNDDFDPNGCIAVRM